jgi:hypothetical protein
MLFFTLCSSQKSTKETLQTVEGVARESKAGLVVEGIVIKDLGYRKVEFYRNKKIVVKGYITEDHPWRLDRGNNEPVKTGFSMPVMYKVLEISEAEEK